MSPTLPIIVTIIVLAFLAFFLIRGLRKGFLRILFTTFSVIVTIALAALLAQPVAQFLQESTFVGSSVEEGISEYVHGKLEDMTGQSGQKDDGKKDAEDDKNPNISSKTEESFIDALALPESIKNNIRIGNTLEKYRDLGVATFSEYITTQLTTVTVRAIAFVLLSIVIYLLLRVIFMILKVIQRIPILRGVNRLLGGILGLAEGLLIVWGICVIIIIFSGSSFGNSCMEVIRANTILSFIYDHNLLVVAIHAVFGLL